MSRCIDDNDDDDDDDAIGMLGAAVMWRNVGTSHMHRTLPQLQVEVG